MRGCRKEYGFRRRRGALRWCSRIQARPCNMAQTMNPSTEDILEAVRKTPAHTVFVLPNNKNIIMAAEQVCELTDIKVIVLPTKSVPQGISALLAFQPDADAEQNREQMTEAFTRVRTGLVTYAARNSEFDGKSIKEGQTLGLLEGKLACVCDSGDKCLKKLFKLLVEDMSSPYITLFYRGCDGGRRACAICLARPGSTKSTS